MKLSRELKTSVTQSKNKRYVGVNIQVLKCIKHPNFAVQRCDRGYICDTTEDSGGKEVQDSPRQGVQGADGGPEQPSQHH